MTIPSIKFKSLECGPVSLPAEHLSDLILADIVCEITVKIQGYKHLNGSQLEKFLSGYLNYREGLLFY